VSFLRSGDSSSQAPNYIGIPIQTSVSTLPKPIVWGTNLVGPNLVWYGDFTKTGSDSSGGGGKGGGGKSGGAMYSASIEMALCEGPIAGIHSVIVDQGVNSLASLSLSLIDGAMPQSPWSYLSSAHPTQALGYQGTALVVGEHYSMGSSPTLPNHQIAVYGLRANTASWTVGAFEQADLALVIWDFLTSPQYGVPQFPSGSINLETLFTGAAYPGSGSGPDASLQTYCRALGMGFSPALVSTESASTILERWLQLANVAAVWSGQALKFIPYGDTAITANGVTYQPNLTPIYDLDDNDFIGDSSEDPVTISRTAPEDLYQVVRCEVTSNDGSFSYVPAEARDQAAIEAVGGTARIMPTISAHEIVSTYLGGISAQLILQRQLYVRNGYAFKLGLEFSALEPMDLVTLTDPLIGLNHTVVRITQIEENDDLTLSFTAEEFPQGIASATAYAKQEPVSNAPNPSATPDPVNTPIIFEPASSLLAARGLL
jgi:hypothetical protein